MSERVELTESEIKDGLRPTASTVVRTNAILAAGIEPGVLAVATDSSVSTVRNWKAGIVEPRMEAAEALDQLRYAMRTMVEGGLDPNAAAQFLKSISGDIQPPARPIELVGKNRELLFELAAQAVRECAD